MQVWIMRSHPNEGAWWQARPAVAIGFMLPGTAPCCGSGDFRSVTARAAVPRHTRTHCKPRRMLISAITAIVRRAHDRQRCHSQVSYGEWANEEELQQVVGAWPMKRLVALHVEAQHRSSRTVPPRMFPACAQRHKSRDALNR